MITFTEGNIFDSPAQVITNTINCVGVMGKGLALEFKKRYPEMYQDYRQKCQDGLVKIGEPYLWENDQVQILNFPTKRHWRNGSRLDDIEAGLKYLAENYAEMGISTLALAPLGCGNGGLEWSKVKPLIVKFLGNIPDLDVIAYSIRQSNLGTKQNDQNTIGFNTPKSEIVTSAKEQYHQPSLFN